MVFILIYLIMDTFWKLCPKEKQVQYLEDFEMLTVSDLKRILRAYKENVSGCKANLLLKVYAIFCRLSSQSQSQPSSSLSSPSVFQPSFSLDV